MDASKIISTITEHEFNDQYQQLHWTGSFKEYLDLVIERPGIARTAFQRVYDMIHSYGFERYEEYKKEIYHWKFFDDPNVEADPDIGNLTSSSMIFLKS